jgi:hypothetical protein
MPSSYMLRIFHSLTNRWTLDQITMWKNKYEALAKLYSQLRQEHLELLGKYKQLQVKAQSSNEAQERLDKMEADMRAKNMELADMIRERDRAKNDLTRMRGVSTPRYVNMDLVSDLLTKHNRRANKMKSTVFEEN